MEESYHRRIAKQKGLIEQEYRKYRNNFKNRPVVKSNLNSLLTTIEYVTNLTHTFTDTYEKLLNSKDHNSLYENYEMIIADLSEKIKYLSSKTDKNEQFQRKQKSSLCQKCMFELREAEVTKAKQEIEKQGRFCAKLLKEVQQMEKDCDQEIQSRYDRHYYAELQKAFDKKEEIMNIFNSELKNYSENMESHLSEVISKKESHLYQFKLRQMVVQNNSFGKEMNDAVGKIMKEQFKGKMPAWVHKLINEIYRQFQQKNRENLQDTEVQTENPYQNAKIRQLNGIVNNLRNRLGDIEDENKNLEKQTQKKNILCRKLHEEIDQTKKQFQSIIFESDKQNRVTNERLKRSQEQIVKYQVRIEDCNFKMNQFKAAMKELESKKFLAYESQNMQNTQIRESISQVKLQDDEKQIRKRLKKSTHKKFILPSIKKSIEGQITTQKNLQVSQEIDGYKQYLEEDYYKNENNSFIQYAEDCSEEQIQKSEGQTQNLAKEERNSIQMSQALSDLKSEKGYFVRNSKRQSTKKQILRKSQGETILQQHLCDSTIQQKTPVDQLQEQNQASITNNKDKNEKKKSQNQLYQNKRNLQKMATQRQTTNNFSRKKEKMIDQGKRLFTEETSTEHQNSFSDNLSKRKFFQKVQEFQDQKVKMKQEVCEVNQKIEQILLQKIPQIKSLKTKQNDKFSHQTQPSNQQRLQQFINNQYINVKSYKNRNESHLIKKRATHQPFTKQSKFNKTEHFQKIKQEIELEDKVSPYVTRYPFVSKEDSRINPPLKNSYSKQKSFQPLSINVQSQSKLNQNLVSSRFKSPIVVQNKQNAAQAYKMFSHTQQIPKKMNYQQFYDIFKCTFDMIRTAEKYQDNLKKSNISENNTVSTVEKLFKQHINLKLFINEEIAYKYQISFSKKIHKPLTIRLMPEHKRYIQSLYILLNLLKQQNNTLYQRICTFLRYPFMTIKNSFLHIDIIQNISPEAFLLYFTKIIGYHRKCRPDQSKTFCDHIEGFKKNMTSLCCNYM